MKSYGNWIPATGRGSSEFAVTKNVTSTVRLCRRYHELQDFLNYFEMNYLNGNFSVRMWNVYERNMDNRTNNSVESKYNFCICPYYEPVIIRMFAAKIQNK